ncbi:Uncharacterised protein [Bordetella pertussis]|nr:Uncharacterised protein [Bordetella pertussis]
MPGQPGGPVGPPAARVLDRAGQLTPAIWPEAPSTKRMGPRSNCVDA